NMPPKKVAAVVTEYRKWSHADVILRNLLDGYPGGKRPDLELVSLFTDQVPKGDMSRDLAKKHGFKIAPPTPAPPTPATGNPPFEAFLPTGEPGRSRDTKKARN